MLSKWSQFFQMISNFPDYFKSVWIFPDDCQFSGWFQNFSDFPYDCQFSELQLFQTSPDFSRRFPIFRMVSKLSGFFSRWLPIFRMISKLSGFSRWLPIFQMISKLSGFSRWLPIFRMISKLSRFFQMTANFLDDFKSVWIFPDANGNPRANAANFVWQANFCLGGRR